MSERVSNEYYLGGDYPGIYFTQREVDCLMQLLTGHTIVSAAAVLELSPRTVEFYVKNMRMKVGVQTKVELLQVVREIDFISQFGVRTL